MLIKEILNESAVYEKYIRLMLSRALNKTISDDDWREWKENLAIPVSHLLRIPPSAIIVFLRTPPYLWRPACVNFKDVQISADGTVNVDGRLNWGAEELHELPITFGRVEGSFQIPRNHLKSFKGCPTYIGGSFDCSNNLIESLEHIPSYVGKDFFMQQNARSDFYFSEAQIREKCNVRGQVYV